MIRGVLAALVILFGTLSASAQDWPTKSVRIIVPFAPGGMVDAVARLMATRFILVRHAETIWNSEERMQGWLDPPLSERGLQQAALVAERLKEEHIDAIYASPQERARTTADCIARHHSLPVQLDERLREQFLGALQGLTSAEVAARFPERVAQFRSTARWVQVADEETMDHLSERVCGCCQEMIARHAEQTVVVVSHGGALNRLLITWLGIDAQRRSMFDLFNASITRISTDGVYYRVRCINDTQHLQSLPQNHA